MPLDDVLSLATVIADEIARYNGLIAALGLRQSSSGFKFLVVHLQVKEPFFASQLSKRSRCFENFSWTRSNI